MHVRQALAPDVEQIAVIQKQVQALHVELEPRRYKPIDDTRVLCQYLEEWLTSSTRMILVADSEHRVVGYLTVEIRESSDTPFTYPLRYAHIDQMGVLQEKQGSGVGSMLIQEVASWCTLQGVELIHLDVRTTNQQALGFYQKCGFSASRLRMSFPIVG